MNVLGGTKVESVSDLRNLNGTSAWEVRSRRPRPGVNESPSVQIDLVDPTIVFVDGRSDRTVVVVMSEVEGLVRDVPVRSALAGVIRPIRRGVDVLGQGVPDQGGLDGDHPSRETVINSPDADVVPTQRP